MRHRLLYFLINILSTGITAVDASDVLDIMLSDYPHKYEEYRSHQRQRQLQAVEDDPPEDIKPEERVIKVEMKAEKMVEHKPELPKVDPEKTRQVCFAVWTAITIIIIIVVISYYLFG